MHLKTRLLSGPLAAGLLVAGVLGLASMIPGYRHALQTVSEIGETGSPVRWAFTLLLCGVAACVFVFAGALRDVSRAADRSRLPAYLAAAMAVSIAGVGVFAHPHPLHNVFGLSELIGYQAPLAFAIAWRRDRRATPLVALSWILYAIAITAIALNLSALDRDGVLWSYVQPRLGLAQRALFAAWFAWIALVGVFFSRSPLAQGTAGRT